MHIPFFNLMNVNYKRVILFSLQQTNAYKIHLSLIIKCKIPKVIKIVTKKQNKREKWRRGQKSPQAGMNHFKNFKARKTKPNKHFQTTHKKIKSEKSKEILASQGCSTISQQEEIIYKGQNQTLVVGRHKEHYEEVVINIQSTPK